MKGERESEWGRKRELNWGSFIDFEICMSVYSLLQFFPPSFLHKGHT